MMNESWIISYAIISTLLVAAALTLYISWAIQKIIILIDLFVKKDKTPSVYDIAMIVGSYLMFEAFKSLMTMIGK